MTEGQNIKFLFIRKLVLFTSLKRIGIFIVHSKIHLDPLPEVIGDKITVLSIMLGIKKKVQ
jgi:hypothetical protein